MLNNKLKCTLNYGLVALFCCYIVSLSILFWNFPMLFFTDSYTYIDCAKAVAGLADFSSYYGFRGLGISVYLGIFLKIFGTSVLTIKLAYFCLYLTYIIVIFFIFKKLNYFDKLWGLLSFPLVAYVCTATPLIITYSHCCLSEFLALVAACISFLIFLSNYNRTKPRTKHFTLINCCIAALMCCVIYSVKQASALIPLIIFCGFELLNAYKRKSFKPLLSILLAACLSIIVLFSYIKITDKLLRVETITSSDLASYSGSFFVDSLRYFCPEERNYSEGYENTIYIMDNAYENELSAFPYTFKGTFGDGINYWLTCFFKSPERVFASYKDNIGLISGAQICHYGRHLGRAFSSVTHPPRFFTGQENELYVSFMSSIDLNSNYHFVELSTLTSNPFFDREKYLDSPITKLFLMNILSRFSFFQYSFFSYFSGILLILSILALVFFSKHIKNKLILETNCVLCFSTFFYILFLAITAQSIDRYGIPILFLNCILICNIGYLMISAANLLYLKVKSRNVKPKQDD